MPKPRFSSSELRYLTEIDGFDHVAIVAVSAEDPDVFYGVARFVRLREDPETAEAAIVVADALQGQGLGRELGRRLADEARERGVKRFTATLLGDNVAAHRLFRSISERLEHAELGPARDRRRARRVAVARIAAFVVTSRVGPKVAQGALRLARRGARRARAARERRRRAARRTREVLGREYAPERQVAGRFELAARGVRGGVDVRGDGSAEAYTRLDPQAARRAEPRRDRGRGARAGARSRTAERLDAWRQRSAARSWLPYGPRPARHQAPQRAASSSAPSRPRPAPSAVGQAGGERVAAAVGVDRRAGRRRPRPSGRSCRRRRSTRRRARPR